jgi:hypothetical protein
MAFTTAAAFTEFGAKLRLTDAQKETVAQRRQRVDNILRQAFPASSNMPVLTTRVIGSARRNTIIRPLDDIDVLAVFDDSNVWSSYRNDSRRLLYRVRDALTEYQIEVVGARGQAVRLFYKQAPHVDIATVFAIADRNDYVLPRGNGDWLVTDPDGVDAFLDRRQRELGNNLRPLVRLLKRWNNVHSRRLRSFHLEMIAQAAFRTLGSDMRAASMRFFEWAPRHLNVADPTNGESLGSRVTYQQRTSILTSFESALQRAMKANQFELAGNHKDAIYQWQQVFGAEFPSYG